MIQSATLITCLTFIFQRLPFTLGFIGSMVGTIYVSMVLHSYILSVIFSVLQVNIIQLHVLSHQFHASQYFYHLIHKVVLISSVSGFFVLHINHGLYLINYLLLWLWLFFPNYYLHGLPACYIHNGKCLWSSFSNLSWCETWYNQLSAGSCSLILFSFILPWGFYWTQISVFNFNVFCSKMLW